MNLRLEQRYSEKQAAHYRWRTAIWLGKSARSDEHIIGVDTVVLVRSVRRQAGGKRWSERVLKLFKGTPWNPQPEEVVMRRRHVTRALVERYGPTEDCGHAERVSSTQSNAGHGLNSCAQEKMDQLRLEPRRGCKLQQISNTESCFNGNTSRCSRRWRLRRTNRQ